METLVVGDLFISSEAIREAIEKELGEDFGPVREVAWNGGEIQEEQHHVQQVMEQDGPEAVDVPEEIIEAVGDAEVMALHFPPGPEAVRVDGRNLKVVIVPAGGFGNVGRQLATRIRGFDVELLVYDPYVDEETIESYGGEKVEDMERIFREGDFV